MTRRVPPCPAERVRVAGYLATHDAASSPLATILVTGAVAVLLLGLIGLAVVGRRVRSASD